MMESLFNLSLGLRFSVLKHRGNFVAMHEIEKKYMLKTSNSMNHKKKCAVYKLR